MNEFFKAIDADMSDARGIFALLDTNDSGTIELDEFLNGCLELHGPAKALHLSTLMYEMRLVNKLWAERLSCIEKCLKSLALVIGVEDKVVDALLPGFSNKGDELRASCCLPATPQCGAQNEDLTTKLLLPGTVM